MTDEERRAELEPLFSESPKENHDPITIQRPKPAYKYFQNAKKCPYHGWAHYDGKICEINKEKI